MNELALFAGAGGGILGGKLLGWRTVCAVEYDEYARNVLCTRQDDGSLPAFPEGWAGLKPLGTDKSLPLSHWLSLHCPNNQKP